MQINKGYGNGNVFKTIDLVSVCFDVTIVSQKTILDASLLISNILFVSPSVIYFAG